MSAYPNCPFPASCIPLLASFLAAAVDRIEKAESGCQFTTLLKRGALLHCRK